jgi:hypothetical protein
MFTLKDSPWELPPPHLFLKYTYISKSPRLSAFYYNTTLSATSNTLKTFSSFINNTSPTYKMFNSLTPNLNFTLEEEKNNRINFLDITITKKGDRLSYRVYKKPTTTNSITPMIHVT